MLRHKLLDYLQFSSSAQGLNDHFRIPSTQLSISSLELDPSLFAEHGENALKVIESINHTLEHSEARIDYPDFSIKQLSLAEHIDNWRNLFQYNIDSGAVGEFKKSLVINRVSLEDMFARLSYKVLNGELPKRAFRLHFENFVIPISLCYDHKFHVVHLDLKSVSREAFLFKVPKDKERLLRKANFAQIHLSPSGFFITKDEVLSRELPSICNIKARERREFGNKRLCTFDLDLTKMNFSHSHIHLFAEPGLFYDHSFLQIPFSALNDSCLFTEAHEVESYMTEKIDCLEDELKRLIAA